jgi:hypothetical protein
VVSIRNQSEEFLDRMVRNVKEGMGNVVASNMMFSNNLIEIKKKIKRLEPLKKDSLVMKNMRQDHLASYSTESDNSSTRGGIQTTEFYMQSISCISCAVRVKVKELTINIQCNPSKPFSDFPLENMLIKIKKIEQDNKLRDTRPYIKKLVFLSNRHY